MEAENQENTTMDNFFEQLVNNQPNPPTQPNQELPLNNCLLCHEPFQETIPQVETLCHHKFHTRCFMMEAEYRFSCPTCGNCLLGPDHANLHRRDDERTINRKREKVEKLFMENETVVTDFKLLKRELRKLSSSFGKARKTIKSKQREFKNEIKFFQNQIIERKKNSMKSLRDSQEYKEYLKQRRKTERIVTDFENMYDVTMKDLGRVPDLKLQNTWRYRRALLYSLSYSRRFRVRI